jgi:hypothetical protein
MSYQEKRITVSLITGAFILAAYCIHAIGKFQSGAIDSKDLKFWAGTILIFIGIGIAAMIVTQIIFHILLSVSIAVKEKIRNGKCNEEEIDHSIRTEMVEDEMDKLIDLKSMKISFAVAGTGFVAALISLVLNYTPVVMLNIMFISFSAGSLLEGFTQLYFYRKGINHG